MLARELMTTPVVTGGPGWPVRRAIGILHEHDITALPVLDETGRMVGKVVQVRLGHANPTITMNIYAHVIKGMQAESAETVASLFA